MTKRNIPPYKNYWCLPGGHIEWGEKARKAVEREVKEETGLDFHPKFFGYYDEIINKIKWHAVVLSFFGEAEGEISIDFNEVKKAKWFSKRELNDIKKIAFTNRKIIADYFNKLCSKK